MVRTMEGKGFMPVFTTTQYKPLPPTLLLDPPPRSESIHNNFEVNIGAGHDLNKFYHKLIMMLMLFQTVLLLTVMSYFYARVICLEAETSRLNIVAVQRNQEISDLFQQIYEVRDECQDMYRMDCTMFGDVSSTDSSEQHDIILNVEIDADMVQEDGEEEESDEDRYRRGLMNRDTLRRKKVNQQRAQAKNNIFNKRFQCQKCVAGSSQNTRASRKPSKTQLNRPSSLTSPDVSAIHFKGGLPEVLLKEKVVSGAIGPWFHDIEKNASTPLDFRLESNHNSVKVLNDGIYFIYAQVYYLTTEGTNSFSIQKKGNLEVKDETLATCSSGPGTSLHNGQEVSCFTATVGRLKRGDVLQLSEREVNRRVLFRDGQTYFGMMRLSPTIFSQNPVRTSAI